MDKKDMMMGKKPAAMQMGAPAKQKQPVAKPGVRRPLDVQMLRKMNVTGK